MNTHQISDQFKAIYGVRLEKFDLNYTGQSNLGDVVYDNEKIIDVLDVLPSVNLIYSLNDAINFRTSFSKTLARPSFKEASIAQIYDPFSDRTFIGNIDLQETKIDNYDVRLEYFMPGGQMFAISGFYKSFSNPIEVVAFSEATPNQFQPRNVGDAEVLGLEIEARKNLAFISPSLERLNVGANVSFIQSKVEMDQTENGEYESRLSNARPGEIIEATRQLQGQSPYIINAYIGYQGLENGLEANLSYNVQGPRLSVVGIGRVPDVYEQPFHNLNFKASKSIGIDSRFKFSVSVNNLLNSKNQKFYESFQASDQIFEIFRPERTYGFSIGYSLR
jgi:TonB-dependent receptor